MLKRSALLVGASLLVAALSGCNGGVTVGGDPAYHAWYNVYGQYCGTGYPGPGCNFYADGSKITYNEDPYYATEQWATWIYTDSYGYSQSFTGWARLSDTGILYDDWGNALNSQGEQDMSRDLIAEAAEKEELAVSTTGKAFAAQHALAEDTGIKIARTLNDWAKIGKSRSRTDKDVADLSQRLYGVSLDKVEVAAVAAQAGDKSMLNELNDQVAAYWGTTPETSSAILKTWYKEEAAKLTN